MIHSSTYADLIQQGISDAKGSDKSIELLTEDDLKNLGKLLADREAKIQDLYSVVVDPINAIALAIEKGNYADVCDWINGEYAPLIEAEGTKRIYFVPVTEHVNSRDEEAYVNKFGLTLCKSAPNYLLGVLAAFSEAEAPNELAGKDFIAVDNAASSMFCDRFGNVCFLCVYRDNEMRQIGLEPGLLGLDAVYGWMILAEKP